jgi:hypothetical protein
MALTTCKSCGNQFGCEKSEDCWCAKFPPVLDVPENQYISCFCPECLQRVCDNMMVKSDQAKS